MPRETSVVLDASAMLALLNQEMGAVKVLAVLDRAVISTVNLAEVYARLIDGGMDSGAAVEAVAALGVEVLAFDAEQAIRCGELRPTTRAAGLSLGDRACLAFAMSLDAPVITCNRMWLELPLSLRIDFIR
jgi:PIN domain nuclease of toxin-antitoxin system